MEQEPKLRIAAPTLLCLSQTWRNFTGKIHGCWRRFCKLLQFFKSCCLKGQCHEIFCFWFFSSISFSPAPEYPIRTVSNFFENSRRYSQLKVDHRCRLHRWQMKKIFIQKNFNNFVGTPLDSRVNIYIHFCLQVHFKVPYLSEFRSHFRLYIVLSVWKNFLMNMFT